MQLVADGFHGIMLIEDNGKKTDCKTIADGMAKVKQISSDIQRANDHYVYTVFFKIGKKNCGICEFMQMEDWFYKAVSCELQLAF